MRINIKKDEFSKIENSFKVLQESPNNLAAQKAIEESLNVCFPDYHCGIHVIPININDPSPIFVMGILPDLSTTEKIISAVLENKEFAAIKKLWESAKFWTIEIDTRALKDPNITATELTACLFHEIGHIAYSDSIPNKISTILRYEYAKAPMGIKSLRKMGVFRRILSLPILDACVMDSNASSFKEEIKADKFAKKLGYGKELESLLHKLAKNYSRQSNCSIEDSMKISAGFSLQNIDEFRRRESKLAKNNLIALREACPSPYISDAINECVKELYEGNEDSKSLYDEEAVVESVQRLADRAEEEYVTEFFIFGKHLKRIDPADIDYIQVKINDMHSQNDKMMLLTYLYGKLDMVNYYLDIIQNPKASRKYTVPHSEAELLGIKKRLEQLRNDILNYKIPMRNRNMMISWPSGYEG